MRRRLRGIETRVLPRGWSDVVRQLLLFLGSYLLYQLVRGLVDGGHVPFSTRCALEAGFHSWTVQQNCSEYDRFVTLLGDGRMRPPYTILAARKSLPQRANR